MKKGNKQKRVWIAALACVLCVGMAFSIQAQDTEPVIGNAKNMANAAIVHKNGANVTESYRADQKIKVEDENRGGFGELLGGSTNAYTYSAEVTFSEDPAGYGSIRLVVGSGKRKSDGKDCTIEVGVRPNCNDAVLFANANGDEGSPLGHQGVDGLEIGKTYRYTVSFESGKLSFWVDGNSVFDKIDVAASVDNITLAPEFYSQKCTGYLSKVQIWGDIEALFDDTADNMANAVTVTNNGTDVTADYKQNKTITTKVVAPDDNGQGFGSGSIGNLVFGKTNRYLVSADITYTKDTSSWGSIRLTVGKGLDPYGVEQTVDVCIRPNLDQSLIGCQLSQDPWENWVHQGTIVGLELNKTYRHTVLYDNGKISLWIDGTLVAGQVDMNAALTNLVPDLGFKTQNCDGTISNLIIQGDVSGISVPEFDADKNENVLKNTVLLDEAGTPVAFNDDMGLTYTKSDATGQVRYGFAGLTYGKEYCFTTKAKFHDNTGDSTWSHEGLRMQIATAKKDGRLYRIEINIRQSACLLFAVTMDDGEWAEIPFAAIYDQNNPYGTEQTYSIRYREGGTFDFFQNGATRYSNYDIASQGYTEITPCFGIGGEVCAFTYSDMKLWGDVTVNASEVPEIAEEPKFDLDNDTNLFKQISVKNPIDGKQSVLENCAISSGDNVTLNTMMTVYGIKFGKSYNFCTHASFADNKTPNGESGDVNWEALVVKVATAKKDGKTYDVELHFRKNYALFKAGDVELTANAVFDTGTDYDTMATYTIEYRKDNTISAFINGKNIYYKYDLKDDGYTDVKPAFGFGGEVCSYNYTGLQLWGDVTFNADLVPAVPVEPIFNADTDINLMKTAIVTNPSNGKTKVLDNCELVTAKTYTDSSNATISSLQYGKSYQFSTKAAFYDNKTKNGNTEVDWEGLVFEVAKADKGKETYSVEVRFRKALVGIFVNNEPYALDYARQTNYGTENQYTVAYHSDGTFSVFQNGIAVYWHYDITDDGFKNVQPSFAFGGEACAYSYKDMKLWGDIYLKEMPTVPQMPSTNGNYGNYMRVPQSSMIKYENGTIYSTSDEIAGRTEFEYLPFGVDDTYVFGFNINTKKADQIWMGPRIPFGVTQDGKELALYIMKESIGVFKGEEAVQTVPFGRELNQVYRVDMLIGPDYISVWVDNVLLIENLRLPKKSDVRTGILFENAIAVMSNISLYYTDPVTFVPPTIPEPPVLKTLQSGQYNAADWMKVSLNGQNYGGYFENKLICNDSSNGYRYLFENLPIKDNMSYYYSATYTVTESSEVWKGPRFIFRQDGANGFYVAVLHDSLIVLAGADQVASSPLKLEFGKSYNIVMYSTPTDISVWIDGELVFESVDLTPYISKKLTADPGLLFELCQAKVTNIALYGDGIEFDENYVDTELYYSKYYKMRGIPEMTGANLFENVTMIDYSGGAIGAEYDSENRVLTTAFPEGSGTVTFQDANGSVNLNGLKNETGYVLAFKYKVDAWDAESLGESGFWVTTNRSAGPWTTLDNNIALGFSGDALMINAKKEGVELTNQSLGMQRTNSKVYDVAIVHGKNWIKLYVDNELQMVSTQLPTYNTEFQMWFSNAQTQISDIKLYEFEDSGLAVLKDTESTPKTTAGNTIYDAKEHIFSSALKAPVVICLGAAGVMLISAAVLVLVIKKDKKKRKNNDQMGGTIS